MSKRGRKVKVYPTEEIETILYNYTNEYSPGLLKYSDIYKYAIKLYENGIIKNKYSEDFWRKPGRQGKEAIDKINYLYLTSIEYSKNQTYHMVRTEHVIDKILIKTDKKIKRQLINELKINEKTAEKVIVYSKKVNQLEEDKINLKKEIESLEGKLGEYQKIIFSWAASSHISNDLLFNLTKGKYEESPVLKYSFNKLFDEEENISNFFEGYIKEFINKSNYENDKVVRLEDTRIKKLLQSENFEK